MAVSSTAILKFLRRMEREDVCLHGFELREGGAIRAEGYYAPFEKGQPHRMYSVSKSMVSLAVGLLLEEGKISLDDCITAYFPDKLHGQPEPRLARLTIRDMLRMATCFHKTTYKEYSDFSWSDSYFQVKPSHEPGSMFNYDTSCSQVLGEMCQRVSGKPLLELLQERVFAPLTANDPKRWLTDPAGAPQGGTGLIMSLRDLGKVAQCVMDGGQGILPAEYVRQATARQIGTECQGNPEERYGYGWQFWRTRHGWAMYGLGGQLAVACPEEGLLLCTIADTRLDPYGVQRLYDGFFEEIVGHLGEEGDPADDATLEKLLQNLHVATLKHTPGPWPQGTRRYAMESVDLGLREVCVEDNAISLVWDDGVHTFHWDAWGKSCQHTFPHTDVPCLTSAGWTADGALRVRCQLIGDAPCGLELYISETDDCVSVRMQKSSDPLTNRYEGIAWGERAR